MTKEYVYDATKLEPSILAFWEKNLIYQKSKKKCSKGQDYYFLDGPPYTSGKVDIGTAWNKSLKDMVLRYKRMKGFNVWDRAGYDMHGLPTENATQKKLNLKSKEDIEKFGVDKFIEECKKLSVGNLKIMNDDFIRLGTWMDFENAYQSVKKEFIEGEWWLIKQAHKNGRLYEGLRTMTWCSVTESALAKHELEYKTIVDDSIFVKFKVKGKDEYLIIWTTTPWTIPFNLAIMVNPELEYVKVDVEGEKWIIAKALAGVLVQGVADKSMIVLEEFMGDKLEGLEYEHPFHSELGKEYDRIKKESPKAHTVLMSTEYVDVKAGSGLVHCAPGCGPEDYEVGHKNGINPFNTLDTKGVFPEGMGKFSGLTAKDDDKKFTEALDDAGALIAITQVEHEYPHDWRHHKPAIFRTTKQWFFKVEDLKEKMIELNDKIDWNPKAAYNAFDSWLKNLRDNSISKQRYWGTPIPIWRNEKDDEDYLVIESAKELEELSGKKVDDLHISTVNKIKIVKDGKSYKRIPDILDVWVDAGTVSWNCLDYPHRKDHFDRLFPADFILEGKDQIRGWFNLLLVASMVSMNRASFKSCYMHGFINDSSGRKMSKSLGNVISPYEVIDKFGADTLRYYMISGANPGIDLNYNFDDMKVKNRNLFVFWNLHKYLMDLAKTLGKNPTKCKLSKPSREESYILSRLNSTIKSVTEKMDSYNLPEVPVMIEELLLDLSRSYVQMVRDKTVFGSNEEKENVLWTLNEVLTKSLTMFSIVVPFVSESMYQNFKDSFGMKEESLHLFDWPKHDDKLIDEVLEGHMQRMGSVQQSILNAREKAKLNVRWPLAQAVIETEDEQTISMAKSIGEQLKNQTNIKELSVNKEIGAQIIVKPNHGIIGAKYEAMTAQIIAHLVQESGKAVAKHLRREGKYTFKLKDVEVSLTDQDLTLEKKAPEGWIASDFTYGTVYINTELSKELEAEGFTREVMRRIQQHRKKAGLQKLDKIKLALDVSPGLKAMLEIHETVLKEKVGAKTVAYSEEKLDYDAADKVKDEKFGIAFTKL